MDSWWKTATDAAEKAKTMAQTVSKKGLEFAEATAEEASKKLKDLNLHDSIGAGNSHQQPPSNDELVAYGITTDFIEFVRFLNYSTFRDFPKDQATATTPGQLNPWQAHHAVLVVRSVKEVDELRFVLCPRYMDDERFWAIYFTLTKKNLPDQAYTWAEGDPLPFANPLNQQSDKDIFSGIGSQLQQLGKKIQQATKHTQTSTGFELASILPSSALATVSSSTGGEAATTSPQETATEAQPESRMMLETDPNLEAYLQVAISEAALDDDGNAVEGDGEGDENIDLDLDKYLNELSAEVEEEEEEPTD